MGGMESTLAPYTPLPAPRAAALGVAPVGGGEAGGRVRGSQERGGVKCEEILRRGWIYGWYWVKMIGVQ